MAGAEMRSTDRTLLASLGLSDSDKKDRRHDWACHFLMDDENAQAITIPVLRPPHDHTEEEHDFLGAYYNASPTQPRILWRGKCITELSKIVNATAEKPISKGEGKYRTTIGFLDILMDVEVVRKFVGEKVLKDGTTEPDSHETREPSRLAVEVKIGQVGTGEILRQINLYREYGAPAVFVCATLFDMTDGDVAQLRRHRVFHVQLGPKFVAYCQTQSAPKKPKDGGSLLF